MSKIHKASILLLVLGFCFISYGQNRPIVQPVNIVQPSKVKFRTLNSQTSLNNLPYKYYRKTFWTEKNVIGLDLSEVAFVNWNAGGANSISAVMSGDFSRIFEKGFIRWKNELLMRYGINQQSGNGIRKTDDKLEFNSTIGYRTDSISNWYYSGKFNFRTQFTNGYKYPNTDQIISTIMAPAYFFLGVGAEYGANIQHFNLYASPFTFKSTWVLNQGLANQGAFGVTPAVYDEEGNIISKGKLMRTELGILITNEYNTTIFENIGLTNRISLYSDYINNFGNIDVDWELNFNLKVNQYVLAKLGSHLIYDDDIKVTSQNDAGETVIEGPKIQWKQQLGIGVIVQL
ncbi:DUF3078 domain-containing protein [Aegicerativicinus sediminis]